MEDTASQPEETVLISWETTVRVLSNPSAWRGVALSLGGSFLVTGVLFIFMSQSLNGLYLASGLLAGLLIIFVLAGKAIDTFGGFRVNFILSSLGIQSVFGKEARISATAAIIVGILAGNLTDLAAGSIAKSERDVFIHYNDVTRVIVRPLRHYILIKRHGSHKPIGLYCNKDNFTVVLRHLRERCSSARFLGANPSS